MIATSATSQNAVFFFFFFFQLCDAAAVFFFLSSFNFVMSLRWRRSLSTFSQIWRDSKYESRKSEVPFHIVGNCGDFWRFFKFISIFGDSKKREFATDRSFSQNFPQNGEDSSPEKSLLPRL
jgi:hypothetical protein